MWNINNIGEHIMSFNVYKYRTNTHNSVTRSTDTILLIFLLIAYIVSSALMGFIYTIPFIVLHIVLVCLIIWSRQYKVNSINKIETKFIQCREQFKKEVRKYVL